MAPRTREAPLGRRLIPAPSVWTFASIRNGTSWKVSIGMRRKAGAEFSLGTFCLPHDLAAPRAATARVGERTTRLTSACAIGAYPHRRSLAWWSRDDRGIREREEEVPCTFRRACDCGIGNVLLEMKLENGVFRRVRVLVGGAGCWVSLFRLRGESAARTARPTPVAEDSGVAASVTR